MNAWADTAMILLLVATVGVCTLGCDLVAASKEGPT